VLKTEVSNKQKGPECRFLLTGILSAISWIGEGGRVSQYELGAHSYLRDSCRSGGERRGGRSSTLRSEGK